MRILWIVLLFVSAIVIGVGIGLAGTKLFQWILNKRIKGGAVKLLKGKRENKFDLDGKTIEVNRFIIRDEKNREILIDLKEGMALIPKEVKPKEPIPKEPIKKTEELSESIKDKKDTKKSKKKVSTKNKKVEGKDGKGKKNKKR